MPAVNNVLVVGGGAAGAAAAILLAEAGVAVDLVEVKPDRAPSAPGSPCRATRCGSCVSSASGTRCRAAGYAFDSLGLRAPDPAGTLLVELPDVADRRTRPPATMGMPRPELARILLDRATTVGVKVRFGTTTTELAQDDDGVDVTFADGSTGRYDLVVGADGIRSWTRRMLGIQLETRSVGMGIWRAFGPRPESVTRTDLYYGGPVLHRRLLPHRRELALRLHRRGGPGPLRPDARMSSWPR